MNNSLLLSIDKKQKQRTLCAMAVNGPAVAVGTSAKWVADVPECYRHRAIRPGWKR